MRGPGKTGRLRVCAPFTPAGHRDSDIYHRYAVGMYRQALSGHLRYVRAREVPGIRPRDMATLVRAVLLRLTTSPATRRKYPHRG